MTGPQLVVLGWDSATFDVVDPLIADGRLPVLAGLIEKGVRAPLRSTWPPMTDCAWTSAFTGVNPGAHGIFGSWYRAPGAYACRYFSSSDRIAPSLWDIADHVRYLVWNVPMTYPATRITGTMIAGYGAPPGSQFCAPTEIQSELARHWDIRDLLDKAPHGSLQGFLDDLLRGLEAQSDALRWAASDTGADCVVAVWPEIDRAQHFFWRFRDTGHPLARAVDTVYEAADRATGALAAAWPDATFVVLSDHGAGPLAGDVNVGSWLVTNGYASYRHRARISPTRAAWAMPPAVRRLARRVAPRVARRVMGATLAGQLAPFEWDRTRAFMGFHGDLWLNLAGREPSGTVTSADAGEVLSELSERLIALRDPVTGRAVVADVHPRASVYEGAASSLAPDAIVDSWSAGYRVSPTRGISNGIVSPPHALSGVTEAWSSDHRPVGVFVASGARIGRRRIDEASIYDVTPTLLTLLDQPVPEGLDGRVIIEALDPDWLARHPVRARSSVQYRSGGGAYSDEDAAAVAEHLRDLGYID